MNNLTPKQFDALATLLRIQGGSTRVAAREVLVKGATVADAARTAGTEYLQAYKAVQRARKGLVSLQVLGAGGARRVGHGGAFHQHLTGGDSRGATLDAQQCGRRASRPNRRGARGVHDGRAGIRARLANQSSRRMVRQKVQESMKQVWRSGPPPHIGWWNASLDQMHESWRWWDGEKWSVAVSNRRSPRFAGRQAQFASAGGLARIEWTDYYPPGARVPRINPENLK